MNIHLVLFFTRGVSLRTWSMVGNLDREIALYRFLADHGLDISFVTYGDASDLQCSDRLSGIRILCNEAGLPLEQFEHRLFSLHGRALRAADIIKTNQTYGGELALWAARLFRKPLIARCGYMWSFNAELEKGENSPAAAEARRVEAKVFSAANRVVVTTNEMRQSVLKRFPQIGDRALVIPNYVDTDLFKPCAESSQDGALLFIGRIAPEKNLEALLEAVRSLPVSLTLIGEGKLRPELQKKFSDLGGRVNWDGNVPNSQLPERINKAGIFVLPSLYEGHPKTLLEAMACGAAVVGADSPGIRQLIRHRENGFLCGAGPQSIRAALEELLAQPALRRELGANAREFVVENFSLARIGKMELAMQQEVAKRG
jgi:glycosyltransferase involved in cell wall biosynthesis